MIKKEIKNQDGFTLLEMLFVLTIIGAMVGIVFVGAYKLRQVLTVSSATREFVNNLKKARRYALDSAVTSKNTTTEGYFIEISGNDYFWGECDKNGCSRVKSIKAAQYENVNISSCVDGPNAHTFVKFKAVSGEFVVNSNIADPNKVSNECEITLNFPTGLINTTRIIKVNVLERTVKIAN